MQPEGEHLPPLRGRLFVATLRLQGNLQATVQRLTGSVFLGGVLHGAVGSRWFGLAGQSAQGQDDGSLQQGLAGGLSWRILVPPPRLAVGPGIGSETADVQGLKFGVLMHGGHAELWHAAQQALESLTDLGVGAMRVPVLSGHCLHRALPSNASLPLINWHDGLDSGPILPAALALRWNTPLHLASRSRVQAGHGCTPPSLLAVVRSLRRRVCLLEPDWADALGLDSQAWVGTEEALRRTDAAGIGTSRSRMQVVAWRYGSRTKAAPFLRRGLVGSQGFRVPVPAALQALLSLGSWLGAGESASFGCGQYRWRVRLPNDSAVTAPLPQPWSSVNGVLLD